MKNSKKILAASAVAIMLAPAAISALPQQTAQASGLVGLVGTIRRDGGQIVDDNGNITKSTLPNFSSWKLGQTKQLRGKTYYQVGNNEWVAFDSMDIAENGVKLNEYASNYNADVRNVATVGANTTIVNSNGQNTGRTLPKGSQWQLGAISTINGAVYYEVATNEWIAASSITNMTSSDTSNQAAGKQAQTTTNTAVKKVGTLNSTASIYGPDGKPMGMTLPQGSQWQLGTLITVGSKRMYQVATNEYIDANLVDVNGQTSTTTSTTDTGSNDSVGKIGTTVARTGIVTADGMETNMTLAQGTQWKLGKTIKINGTSFYEVGTNEYVVANNLTINGSNTTSSTTTTPTTSTSTNSEVKITANPDVGEIGTATAELAIVNDAGKSTGSSLPNGSQWKLGRIMNANGMIYYEVGNNEWIPASDLTITRSNGSTTSTTTNTTTNTNTNTATANPGIPTPGNGLIGTTTVAQKTYDPSTNTYGQTLPVNTAWKISKLVVNKYGSYWGQISSNEWVWISTVRLNSGLNLKTYAVSEPEFAVRINK